MHARVAVSQILPLPITGVPHWRPRRVSMRLTTGQRWRLPHLVFVKSPVESSIKLARFC